MRFLRAIVGGAKVEYTVNMLLFVHIVVALGGIVSSTYAFVAPSRAKLNATYGLIALTFATGTYLVITTHSPLLASCVSGLAYLVVTLGGLFAARRKLARQPTRNK